jgi:heme o synthase
MKLQFSTSFSRLLLIVSVLVVLILVGGWQTSANSISDACPSWPVCIPEGVPGWLQLVHRITVGITLVGMAALVLEAWRAHRDQTILLPLVTSVATLFFALVFTGALFSLDQTISIRWLHSGTVWIFLCAFVALVVVTGLFSRPQSAVFPPIDVRQRLRDFVALSKPIIVILLLTTTYAGLVMGYGGFPPFGLTFWTLVGGGMAAAGSSAINQYIDRNLDQLMQRTANRPLAAGRMTPAEGLSYGIAVCILGVYLVAGFVNFLAALLAFIGAVYYVVLYSMFLKKATVQNIVIGGGAGAIPPMVGWAAATGSLDLQAWLLFAIIFFWTPPHFWALAIVRTKDYARAGIPMLPVVRGEKETRQQIFIYTIGLVALTLVLPILGMTGSIYLAASLLFGGGLIYTAWRVIKYGGNKVAWRMYRFSSMYLGFIFLAIVLDTVI